jgi:heme exporter protein C
MFHHFANPSRFNRLAQQIQPYLMAGSGIFLLLGLYFALFHSPADYQQGETVRMMYVHVPSAWIGMSAYTALAVTSFIALIWRHPLADITMKSLSPLGAVFTFLCLVTGALWGKPMWGAWWVWDARLTSMFILFLLFLGHMALISAFDNQARGNKMAALLALVGFVNVPIIKFSVDWWHTLHQPASISRFGMPKIDFTMLIPLILMSLGYIFLFSTLLIIKIRTEILQAKLNNLQMFQRQQNRPNPASQQNRGF